MQGKSRGGAARCREGTWREVSTEAMLREGLQAPWGAGFRMSRQMRPPSSMLGWNTGVVNLVQV